MNATEALRAGLCPKCRRKPPLDSNSQYSTCVSPYTVASCSRFALIGFREPLGDLTEEEARARLQEMGLKLDVDAGCGDPDMCIVFPDGKTFIKDGRFFMSDLAQEAGQ